MARPPRFTDDDILDGAAEALAARGRGVTIADIARTIDGPSGSIYHRFESRDEVLARLWLRSIRRFHAGLLPTYDLPDPADAIAAAARHVVGFCADHPLDARAMLLFRQPELAASGPDRIREEAAHINDAIDTGSERLVVRRYGRASDRRRELMMIATRLGPYGLVRPFIGGRIPPYLGDAVAVSALAICELGDRATE